MKNPYIAPDVDNPTMAQSRQRPLTGDGAEERWRIVEKAQETFMKMLQGRPHRYFSAPRSTNWIVAGEEIEHENVRELYTAMCGDIKRERARIGGDWAVAGVVLDKNSRQHIRSELGQDLVFVVLSMEEDQVRTRLEERHGGNKETVEMLMVRTKILPAQIICNFRESTKK